MKEKGWRTLVVDNVADICVTNGNLAVKGESQVQVPISQLKNIVIANNLEN